MTTEKFLEEIKNTYKEAYNLVVLKNKDYGTLDDPFKNFRSISVLGLDPKLAVIIRVLDKISRIHNLLSKNNDVVDEKIDDTIKDCCNYLAILRVWLEEDKRIDLENSKRT